MRSLGSLFHDALFPGTRVYHDANGNFRGTSTDVTPWYLKNHRNILIGWIMFMLLGWITEWGQNDFSREREPVNKTETLAPWGSPDYVDPYKQYKETHNIK